MILQKRTVSVAVINYCLGTKLINLLSVLTRIWQFSIHSIIYVWLIAAQMRMFKTLVGLFLVSITVQSTRLGIIC